MELAALSFQAFIPISVIGIIVIIIGLIIWLSIRGKKDEPFLLLTSLSGLFFYVRNMLRKMKRVTRFSSLLRNLGKGFSKFYSCIMMSK